MRAGTGPGGDGIVKVLAFGTFDPSSHPRVQVLIDGLAAHGLDVRRLNAPLGLGTADRVRMLHRPWLVPALVGRLLARWSGLTVRALRQRRRWRPDFVLVGYLGHFDVLLARALFRRTPIVLDHLIFATTTAADRGVSGGLRTRMLSVLDRLALRTADVIVVDTVEHELLVPEDLRNRSVVVPVGATGSWFDAVREPDPEASSDPLSVVFFGMFTPLQGAPVIGAALRQLHDRGVPVRATLVGSGQDLATVREHLAPVPTVTWRDWVDPSALPELVAEHEVCLGIFGDTPKALSVVPNKVYQGAAAGCAVVTSDTAPQRRLLEDCALMVPPGDPGALADALAGLAQDRRRLGELRGVARTHAREHFSPASVVEPLVRVLDGCGPRPEPAERR